MATNATTNGTSDNVYLIWGGEGWVAGHLKALLEKEGKKVFTTTVRMQNREAVIAEIEKIKPTHIFNSAGCTGRPNVDWCEDHKEETIRSNVIGTLNLADVSYHCLPPATDQPFESRTDNMIFITGRVREEDSSHRVRHRLHLHLR
jgi:3,5-epimerase/4-reductase